jgi:DNA-binding MurR/RpiR family transcriptional regulator
MWTNTGVSAPRADVAMAPTGATPVAAPASTVEALLAQICVEFEGLSRQLKLIARYVEHHHDTLGLERIQDVAERCEVQPSAVVRFAKRFGYTGFNDMKRVFRDGIEERISPASRIYQERVREVVAPDTPPLRSADITLDYIDGALLGMQQLRRDLRGTLLDDAVELLAQAGTLWVAGARRSFPVASYLAYALQHTDKAVQLVGFVGAMHEGQLRGIRNGDAMLAVSFAPYAPETLLAAQVARTRGARLVVLTDSRMSPLAAEADVVLLVQESSSFGFRSLTNTMVLAQGLFIALACRMERVRQGASAPVLSQ